MPFASLLAIPARVNIPLFFDACNGNINGVEVKFSPTLASGAKFDLSAASSYIVIFDNGGTPQAVNYHYEVVPNALLTASLTGGSLTLANGDLTTALLALAQAGAPYGGNVCIIAFDAANTVIAAVGTWNVSRVP
jgi:hypothetical protein